jgi:PPP family 3-phenylpropionic acid transporter
LRGTDRFPLEILVIYFCYVSVQGINSTYMNLYLDSIGFSSSQIGMTISASTLIVLSSQMLWGMASDRAKYKNTVLILMLGVSAVAILFFRVSAAFWYVLLISALYACFQSCSFPLLDNIVLEASEGKSWNFGQLRAGGTAGYCVTMLCIGFVIGEEYSRIFYIMSAALFICFALSTRMPKVEGRRAGMKKTPFRALFRDKPLMAMFGFSIMYSLGQSFYFSYYPIYFTQLGGTSEQVGVMMFFSGIVEIPSLMFASRAVKRFGADRVLIAVGILAVARYTLLSFLTSTPLIMAASMLQGPAFAGLTYSLINHINSRVAKENRATSQSFNTLLGSVFSRLIFGYVGGVAVERFSANGILLVIAGIMLVTTFVFALWSGKRREAFA